MSSPDLTDAQLVKLFQAGNEACLNVLCERYERALYQFLVGMLRDHQLAEDALQETFVRALERLEGVDPDHLRGWLFTVAYHQASLIKRKRKRLVGVAPLGDDPAGTLPEPSDEAIRREHANKLRKLLETLPENQREVITQRIFEGKRFREIAAYLKCPLNTALARMHEGLKRLRRLWEHENVT